MCWKWTPRVVSLRQADKSPVGKVLIFVEMAQQGDEAALGFTLGFDPARLSNPQVSLVSGGEASLTTNVTKSDAGLLAVLVDSGEPLAKGGLVSVTFDINPNTKRGATDITFTDDIVEGSTADVDGNLLPTRFVGGRVTLPARADRDPESNGLVGYFRSNELSTDDKYFIAADFRRYTVGPAGLLFIDNVSDPGLRVD